VNMLIGADEIAARRRTLEEAGGPSLVPSQTPWQEIQRKLTSQLDSGAVLENAVQYQRIAQSKGPPRDNH
jgi:dihydroxy-acid dehydratase